MDVQMLTKHLIMSLMSNLFDRPVSQGTRTNNNPSVKLEEISTFILIPKRPLVHVHIFLPDH